MMWKNVVCECVVVGGSMSGKEAYKIGMNYSSRKQWAYEPSTWKSYTMLTPQK